MFERMGVVLEVKFYDCDKFEENKLIFAVVMARYNDKWIVVRHKERNTWEIPGGHIEPSEGVQAAASRELFEETGAIDFTIYPVNVYSVNNGEQETYGQLFYAEVRELGKLPQTEIAEIKLVDELPENLTYPLIQPILAKRVQEYIERNNVKKHNAEE